MPNNIVTAIVSIRATRPTLLDNVLIKNTIFIARPVMTNICVTIPIAAQAAATVIALLAPLIRPLYKKPQNCLVRTNFGLRTLFFTM